MTNQSSLLELGERIHERCGCTVRTRTEGSHRFELGSTPRKYERSREFAVTHLRLDVEPNFKTKSIAASARLDFVRRAKDGHELCLDGLGFVIERVLLSLSDQPEQELSSAEYSYDGDTIVVPLSKTVESGRITVIYQTTPRLGLYFLEPDAQVPDRPLQLWSQCQDEDGKHWFPCQDKPHVKMTYEMLVRVPSKMTALSGGRLLSKRKLGTKTEYHYSLTHPTPAYLVTLVVGIFEEWSDTVTLPSGRTVDLRYLVPPGRMADGKRAFEVTPEAIRLFSEKTGVEYPYDSYSQVVVSDFIFGGMENTTATTMYEHILLDKNAALDMDSHDLVAHELAHHWFGDLVTCRDWPHAWLNEGFATYFEHVERERRLGLDEYEHFVTADLNIYLGEAQGNYQRAIVCRDYDEPIDLFDRHLYQKGGLVLHMLRKRLGDTAFFSAISAYLSAHRGGIVETNDLVRALEATSGLSLDRFFDEWVYRPGHPNLKINVSFERNVLVVDVEQTQKGKDVAVFELPFEIEVGTSSGSQVHRRIITERKASVVVTLPARPLWVNIDPNYLTTAPITLTAPADLLYGLLRHCPQARGRRLAALTLGRRQDQKTITELAQALSNESETWMVRAKAAESLGKIGGDEAQAALIAALSTSELKVQKAVVEALGDFKKEEVSSALVPLTKSRSYLVTAAAARALGKQKSSQANKLLRQLLTRESWAEVVRSAALFGLSRDPSEDITDLLLDWTRYGRPSRARRAALSALAEMGEGNKVRLHLEGMLTDRDPHVRGAVLFALGAMKDGRSEGAISDLIDRELDGGVKSRAFQVLKDLATKGTQDGVRGVKDEQLKLRQELQTMARRLSQLEQKTDAKPSLKETKGAALGSSPARAKASTKKTSRRPTPSAKKRK